MPTDFLQFTGTGSALETMDRFHSSFVFCISGKYFLVDAGDGISRALLNLEIPYNDIKGILISHMHPDHYSGLAGLLIQMKLLKRTSELSIYLHSSLRNSLINFLKTSYLFPEKFNFTLNFMVYENDQFFHPFENLEVIGRQNSHLDAALQNSNGDISISCSSYLFNFNNKLVFYTGDIGSQEDLYIFKDFSIHLMISEATHVEPEKILESFKISGADRLYLTHLSPGDDEKFSELLKSAGKVTAGKVTFSNDGLKIPF